VALDLGGSGHEEKIRFSWRKSIFHRSAQRSATGPPRLRVPSVQSRPWCWCCSLMIKLPGPSGAAGGVPARACSCRAACHPRPCVLQPATRQLAPLRHRGCCASQPGV